MIDPTKVESGKQIYGRIFRSHRADAECHWMPLTTALKGATGNFYLSVRFAGRSVELGSVTGATLEALANGDEAAQIAASAKADLIKESV